jgi:hypothetical protein
MKNVIFSLILFLSFTSALFAGLDKDVTSNTNANNNIEIRTVSNRLFINITAIDHTVDGYYSFECSSDFNNYSVLKTKNFSANDDNIKFSFMAELSEQPLVYRIYKYSGNTVEIVAEYTHNADASIVKR